MSEPFNRQREVRLHDGQITTRSLGRRHRADDPRARELPDWVERTHQDFQTRFGYAGS